MKKHRIYLAITALALLFAVFFAAFSLSGCSIGTAGLEYELTDHGTAYEVSKGEADTNGKIVIPSKHNGKPVTAIADGAFAECEGITGVSIGKNITNIGSGAFVGCTGLKKITVPNNVTNIGSDAFEGCTGLKSANLGKNIVNIGNYAFFGCSSLTDIIIPDSVINLGHYAFYNCRSLKSAVLSDKLKIINTYLFFNCESLTSITIPDKVTAIYSSAFEGCTSLTSLTIGKSLEDFSAYVFYGQNLTEIKVSPKNPFFKVDNNCLIGKENNALIMAGKNSIIPDYITAIGHAAFFNRPDITNITIPSGVTSIDYYAFVGCPNLKSITLSNNVTYITNAFWACDSLTIYAQTESALDGWVYWNNSSRPVVWGCTLSADKAYVESFVKTENSIENPDVSGGLNSPYRDGYTFKEWNTSANGSGAAYSAANVTAAPNDTVLYAVWTKN